MASSGIKITLNYRPKKVKIMLDIIFAFCKGKKNVLSREGGGAVLGVVSGAPVASWGSKITIDYPPKKSK